MTAKPALHIIVTPMHRLGVAYARKQGWEDGTFKTVTQAQTLRGWSRDTPIVVLNAVLPYQDTALLRTVKERFSNVRYE